MKKIIFVLSVLLVTVVFAQKSSACTPKDFVMPDGTDYAVHFLNNAGDCLSFPVYFDGIPGGRVGTYFFDDKNQILFMQKDNDKLGNDLGNLIALGDGMITIMYQQRGLSLAWALQTMECQGDGASAVLGYFGWPGKEKASLAEVKEVCPDMYLIPRPPR